MARTQRAGPGDEKITINLGPVDLGSVDLLVEEGFYASRTDLIRAAIRRLLDEHRSVLNDALTRRELTVGFVSFDRQHLEGVRDRRERLDVRVVGVFALDDDVSPELADETLERVWVLGSFRAARAVAERLGDKVARGRT